VEVRVQHRRLSGRRQAGGRCDERARRELLEWRPPDPGKVPSGDWRRTVTVMVTTFQRPGCVVQLLKSIRHYFPQLPILVCDSSTEPLFDDGQVVQPGITWLRLPNELEHTVGAGRNHLIRQVKTEYFFLCDDDHVFTRDTDMEAMHRFLERHDYDLVGGCQGREDYGTAIFDERDRVVYQRFYKHYGLVEAGVVRCDRVSNSYLARTGPVRELLWEHRVYASEHAEFFLRASRRGLKIAQMGGVYVRHDRSCEEARGVVGRLLGWLLPHRDREYHKLMVDGEGAFGAPSERARELERKYCFEKNGIERIESVSNPVDKAKLRRLLRKREP
jgi:hypothetical protein